MSDVVLAKYDEKRDLYDTFTQKMASLIREILSGSDINIHSITQRTKDRKSLVKKLSKPNANYSALEEVTDISAVRITTYFEDDVNKVVDILTKEFEIDAKNSVDKRVLLDPDRFGYLSTHQVATLGGGRCTYPEYRRFNTLKFEIQTRSILQHAWAEIEHDLGYKSILEVPKEIRRRFSRLSGLLELADSEFIAIREQVTAYGKNVLQEINEAPEAVEINKDALIAFAQSNHIVVALDKLIAQLGNWELEVMPDRVSIQLNSLNFVGIATIADLRAKVESNAARVGSFARAWISTPRGMGEKRTGVGISFSYLAHVLSNDQGRLPEYLETLGLRGESRDRIAKGILTALGSSREE